MSRRAWLASATVTAALSAVATMTATAGAVPVAPSLTAEDPAPVTHTVTLDLAGDTWVNSLGQTTSQATSPELVVGSTSLGLAKARTYLDFDYAALADIPAGAVVEDASLTLSNFETGSCTGSAIRLSQVTGAWSVGGLRWGAQPAVTSTGSTTSTESYGATGCAAEGDVTFDATAIAKSWVAGSARRGVQIRAVQENAKTGFRKYRSAENGDAAKAATLTVTYNARPSAPEELTVAPELGAIGLVSSLTPTLSAKLSDPDGDAVHAAFEVRKGTTILSPVVWSGDSEPVASGEVASVTLPADVLLDATIYTVSVYAHDASLRSNDRISKAFKVDVTAPTVSVTSDVLTDGTWTNPTPAKAKFTLNGSADVGGFYLIVDGQELAPVGANSSGDYATTLTPTTGWHTFEITPVDRAGNLGPTETFEYGTGAPTLVKPTQWQTSTGDLAVVADAPAPAVGASLEWRVWGQENWVTAGEVDRSDAGWDGSLITDRGRSTTGPLTWHAALEVPTTRPLALQVRVCFEYDEAEQSCTAERFVVLDND